MSSTKQLSATLRTAVGKGAARADRRLNRVPAVIYGDNKPPIAISLDAKVATQNIYAGHFLSTIFEVEVAGQKHRVIPKDYQLDVVKDFPMHIDFLRLGEGSEVTVEIPVHIVGSETSPGVKAGGTVNIVAHAVELTCLADRIPGSIDVDISKLTIGHSIHLSDITLPPGTRAASKENATLVTMIATRAS